MMDPLGVNNALPDGGDPSQTDVDKIELDLDGNDFDFIGSVELDKLLTEEAKGSGLDFNDSDIDKMINPDDVDLDGLGGSDSSLDGLASMPIVEVEDKRVEALLGALVREENIHIPPAENHSNMVQIQNNTPQSMMFQDARPDPLLDQRSEQMHQHSMSHQSRAMEVDALQRMVDDAVNTCAPQNNDLMRQGMNQMNQPPRGLDLEHEKLKLLSRLNEINQRQNTSNAIAPSQPQPIRNGSAGNMFLQNDHDMSEMSNMLRHHQQSEPSRVASIGGMGGSGETPLTSFLRKGKKTQPSQAASVAGRSMLSMNVPGAPKAASIFSEAPIEFDNPLIGQRKSQNAPFGAMDRATGSQDIIRKLSERNLMARSDSGRNMRGGLARQNSNSRNAAWGDVPSCFKTSGILPKHASDTHLMRASKGGLVGSRSKAGSMSRENMLYNHLKKSTSRNQMQKEDSMGQLLPFKRRQGVAAKYKLGASRSVPHLMMNNSGGRGGPTPNEYQKNAMW